MSDLPTWDYLDALVDTDPIKLRDEAWELRRRLEPNEQKGVQVGRIEPRHTFVPDGTTGWCKASLSTGGQCAGESGHPIHGPMPLSVEQQLNTYADSRSEGLYGDPAGPAYVGANGRRPMLRATGEGLYVGGVLVTDRGEARALAAELLAWADVPSTDFRPYRPEVSNG